MKLKYTYRAMPRLHVFQVIDGIYKQNLIHDGQMVNSEPKPILITPDYIRDLKKRYRRISNKEYELLKLKIL